jgi:acetyl-CoA acyltransferase 1
MKEDELIDFIMFAVVNEAARVLEEGIAIRASDIDVCSVMGFAFPAYRGGLMKWAEMRGWKNVVERLQTYHRLTGLKMHEPASLLSKYACGNACRGCPMKKCVFDRSDDDVVIVAASRTALGRAKRGSFAETRMDNLLAPVLRSLIQKSKIDPSLIDDIIIGTVLPKSDVGATECRVAQLIAGIPHSVPIRCVNRLCSSGAQTIADGAASIRSGFADVVIAGGVESMSINPFDWTMVQKNPNATGNCDAMDCYLPMGLTSENVARQYNISRLEQDMFAVESHRRSVAAIKRGLFEEEIVPVETTLQGKKIVVKTDEGPRGDTTLESLSKLKPAFAKDGASTAGNSSQLTDGAAAVLMMTRRKARELGLPIQAVFRGFSVVGVPPGIMGVGPGYAIPDLLKKTGLNKDQVDVFEINEAFASQAIWSIRQVGIPSEKVNPNGGAISMGHPLGCTGARLAVSLIHHLRRNHQSLGVVSMCIGTGMGAALLLEVEY